MHEQENAYIATYTVFALAKLNLISYLSPVNIYRHVICSGLLATLYNSSWPSSLASNGSTSYGLLVLHCARAKLVLTTSFAVM